jgi:pimeloyl-ACP methyl ester carboxylesterase
MAKAEKIHTVILVHGAWGDGSGWRGVTRDLQARGVRIVAAQIPLTSLADDAAAVRRHLDRVPGPVVLVGHSYGGAVITNVDPEAGEIVGLVYVAAFAPKPGDSCFELSAVFPGSTLGDALQPIPRADGTTDLTIVQERFHEQFCADVPAPQAARMAATQRPVTQEALVEPSDERSLWRELPSWFVFGEEDRNIPKAVQHYMAERAHAHRHRNRPARGSDLHAAAQAV